MHELLATIEGWRAEGKEVALATVVKVWGSAPRQPGSRMAVSSAGEIAGSVSGGCVEGAVVEEAQAVLAAARPKLIRFGVTDDEAWAVGLTCGGTIEVFVEPTGRGETYDELRRSLEQEHPVALATVVSGPGIGKQLLVWPDGRVLGDLGSAALDSAAADLAAKHLGDFSSGRTIWNDGDDEVDLFVETLPPRRRLIVVGASHVAIPLVRMARSVGFRTCVIDPRARFATAERFPDADELIVEWPVEALERIRLNEASYVAVLSHDQKLDVPALSAALRSPARYVGVLGSRRTHAKRVAALREAGHTDEELARIHAPIGLELGARTPEEIAVSILAEVVAASRAAPR